MNSKKKTANLSLRTSPRRQRHRSQIRGCPLVALEGRSIGCSRHDRQTLSGRRAATDAAPRERGCRLPRRRRTIRHIRVVEVGGGAYAMIHGALGRGTSRAGTRLEVPRLVPVHISWALVRWALTRE